MAEVDKVFAGDIPTLYDTCLVPLILDVYAEDLARRSWLWPAAAAGSSSSMPPGERLPDPRRPDGNAGQCFSMNALIAAMNAGVRYAVT